VSIRVLAPALLAAAAALPAAEPELKISPTLVIQTRGDINSGKSAGGADLTPGTEGAAAVEGDTVDFYIRRARLGAKVSYGALSAQMTVSADNLARGGGAPSGANVGIYDAVSKYTFKGESVSHEIRGGLYQAIFNPSAYSASGWHLLPASAATENLAANRSVGVGYGLDSEMVDLAVDVQNTRADGSNQTEDGDGLWISGRLTLSPGGEWNLPTWRESFAGAAGKDVAVGLEFATESDETAAVTTDTTSYGIDVLVHLDGLSALVEYRAQTVDVEAGAETDSTVLRVQAGYGFTLGNGTVIEPAARVQLIDMNTDNDDEQSNFDGATARDFGGSGTEIDLGANWYISGNKNKVSALVTLWDAEDGDGEATIFRVQHQIVF
jgi:hypothetical protein